MSAVEDLDINGLREDAVRLAPAFRDKYDFSDLKDYARLAHHAFAQAQALRTRGDELLAEAYAKDHAAAELAAKHAKGGAA